MVSVKVTKFFFSIIIENSIKEQNKIYIFLHNNKISYKKISLENMNID